jgi:2-aminoadipate transaminase
MVLAEFCTRNFSKHVPELRRGLRAKLETLMESLREHFGSTVEFSDTQGGIFLWVELPIGVDTMKLYEAALDRGVAINPGPQWSVNKERSRNRLRLCFASASHEEIHEGIAALADVCRRDFGVSAPGAR